MVSVQGYEHKHLFQAGAVGYTADSILTSHQKNSSLKDSTTYFSNSWFSQINSKLSTLRFLLYEVYAGPNMHIFLHL